MSIKVLNAGAWSRGGSRVSVSLPKDLEDFLPEADEFYRKQHNGRKLQWLHHWSHGTVRGGFAICPIRVLQIAFGNALGRYDLDVTTLQMSVLFCWNDRARDRISFENLLLATELPQAELRRTLYVSGEIGSDQAGVVVVDRVPEIAASSVAM